MRLSRARRHEAAPSGGQVVDESPGQWSFLFGPEGTPRPRDAAGELGQRLSPLTVMPMAILGTAVLCDFGARISGVRLFGVAGFYNMSAGLIVSFVALVIVLADLVTAASGSAGRQVVGMVSASMTGMTGVFVLLWCVRFEGQQLAGAGIMVAELAALAIGGVGVWFAHGVVIGRRLREPVQVWLPASLAQRR